MLHVGHDSKMAKKIQGVSFVNVSLAHRSQPI